MVGRFLDAVVIRVAEIVVAVQKRSEQLHVLIEDRGAGVKQRTERAEGGIAHRRIVSVTTPSLVIRIWYMDQLARLVDRAAGHHTALGQRHVAALLYLH